MKVTHGNGKEIPETNMSESFAQECQFHQEKDSAAPIFVPRAQGQKGNIIAARARTHNVRMNQISYFCFLFTGSRSTWRRLINVENENYKRGETVCEHHTNHEILKLKKVPSSNCVLNPLAEL